VGNGKVISSCDFTFLLITIISCNKTKLKNRNLNTVFIIALVIFLAMINSIGFAQVKISATPSIANPDAILEIESNNKGLLLPRLALVSTTLPAPLNNFVKGMVVYDTVSVNDVTPGIYYCDGTKWVKMNGGVVGGNVGMNVEKRIEIVASTGQTIFTTPVPITDANKIFLYRNGVTISFNVIGSNSIQAEIASVQNDEIRIVQIF
jgi:hypothetical protein